MIGVFDSGVGGLSVLRVFLEHLPRYSFVYVGDNERAPFGDLSFDEIYKNTCEGLDFLFAKGCKIVIIACNSISAKALRRVQQEFLPKHYPNKRVLGIIIPTVESVKKLSVEKNIGMIATSATIKSRVYIKEFKKNKVKNNFFCRATPGLVPLIENKVLDIEQIEKYLNKELGKLMSKKIKVLILGCTHYFLILDLIKSRIDKNIEIINIPLIVAHSLKKYLKKHELFEKKLNKKSKLLLYTSLDDLKKAQVIFEKHLNIANCPQVRRMRN